MSGIGIVAKERERLTDEVDDEAAVGDAAGGAAEVGAPLRQRDVQPHRRRHPAGVRVGVAEVEDRREIAWRVAAAVGACPLGELQQEHDEEQHELGGGRRSGGAAAATS